MAFVAVVFSGVANRVLSFSTMEPQSRMASHSSCFAGFGACEDGTPTSGTPQARQRGMFGQPERQDQPCGRGARQKIKGRKRHLLTDTQGLALEVMVTPANVSENAGAKALWRRAGRRCGVTKRLRRVWVDQGYKVGLVHWCQGRYGVQLQIVEKPKDQKGFAVQPRRWVVERTFSWFSAHRRLSLDYENITANSESMIWLALTRILIRRIA